MCLTFLLLILVSLSLRLYFIISKRRRLLLKPSETCRLAVFLGSGGHTSEVLILLSTLDFDRYVPRTYVLSEGDTLSADKAVDLENTKAGLATQQRLQYRLLTIPRARRVHQSLLTSGPTILRSFMHCLYHITLSPASFADVLILNGPGTCIPICAAVYVNRFLGLPSPTLIYVESFARVRSLSLTGKLLRPLVDRFVVQWPELLTDKGRGDFRGWLV